MSGCPVVAPRSSATSERDGEVTWAGCFPILVVLSVLVPSERCSTFRRLEKLSAAVAALRKLLRPVLVLVTDRGRSCRLRRSVGRLRSFSSPLAPGGVDEIADSGDRLLRERLKAAINLKAVRGYSGESGVWGGGVSMLCSTNGTSDMATF